MREVVAGEDLHLTKITRDHVRRFCEVLKGMPKNRNKDRDYRGKSFAELASMEIPPGKRMDPSTVAERFTATRTFLKWAESEYGRDIGFEARWLNEAFQMPKAYKRAKSGRVKSNRDHFTVDELKTLFDPSTYLPATDPHPSRFWCPLVALFTGMRINEIAQLRHADLRQQDGVWVFDVNSRENEGKTEAGKRLVPIHLFLIDRLGLLDYSHRTQTKHPLSQNLFPELAANVKRSMAHTVGQWFTRYRRGLDIGGGTGEKSSKVFHSFRNTVVHQTLRVDLIAPQLVQAVVGHEEKGADIGVTARYAGRYPVATLRDEVICKLTWDQDIPALAELAASKWARGK
jgi:integrase